MKARILLPLSAIVFSTVSVYAGDFETPLAPPTDAEISNTDKWEFGFRPYLWMTGLEGTIGANGVSAPVDVSFGDILGSLDFAWSSTLEARKGKWGVLLDFTYLKLSDDFTTSFGAPAPPIQPSGFEVEMFLVDLVGSYRAAEWDGGHFDLTAGVRWMSLENTINLATAKGSSGSTGVKDDWFDPHIGFRVQQDLNEKFYLKAFADVGGFSVGSDMTYQLLGGVGWRINDRVALELAYRYLKEDYNNSPTMTFDAEMAGPVLGLAITW